MQKIRAIFDQIAKYRRRYESTDCSKILHTILPHLIVMWDPKIRLGILGNENKKKGSMYALDFLPKMQKELLDAIDTCVTENKLEREETIKYIRQECGNETLPKLIDELNYVTHTRTNDFKYYLEKNKENDKLSFNDFRRLLQKLPINYQ